VKLKGAVVLVPINVPFAEKATEATVPPGSEALTVIGTVAGAVYVEPLVGLVIETVGRGFTVIATPLDAAPARPTVSVATAVSV
jgi:hypothetical protein